MGTFIDLTNRRFNRWLVIKRGENNALGRPVWKCLCDCGTERVVQGTHLRNGVSRSCGCFKNDRAVEVHSKHNSSGSSEYIIWQGMKARCSNPNRTFYNHYGGRGITVCPKWINSFENFIKDMGFRPSPDHSLERKNNDGNYEPGNCRWATQSEQNRNRRNNHLIEFDGVHITLTEASERTGIRFDTLWSRVKNGWPAEKVLSKSVQKLPLFTINGETKTVAEWASEYSVKAEAVRSKLRNNCPIETALGLVRYVSPLHHLFIK